LFAFAGRAEADICDSDYPPPYCPCKLQLKSGLLFPEKNPITGPYRPTTDTYEAKYSETYFSPVCGMAFAHPIQTSLFIRGVWNRLTKTATESIAVKAKWLNYTAIYEAKTTQKCSQNPWEVYATNCPFNGAGVTKVQQSSGWSYTPWAGFNYRGPYPVLRLAMPCCWFQPFGY